MYKTLFTAVLFLAVAALTCSRALADAQATPAKGDGSHAAGGVGGAAATPEVSPVAVVQAPQISLTVPERVLMGIGCLLLAIVVAQLAFLRSSIEKMTGERSLSNPTGSAPR